MEEFAGLQPVKLSDSSLDDSSTDSKSSESEKKNDERPMEMLAVDEEVPGTPNGDDVDESVTPSRDSSSTPYQPTFREFISRHGVTIFWR